MKERLLDPYVVGKTPDGTLMMSQVARGKDTNYDRQSQVTQPKNSATKEKSQKKKTK